MGLWTNDSLDASLASYYIIPTDNPHGHDGLFSSPVDAQLPSRTSRANLGVSLPSIRLSCSDTLLGKGACLLEDQDEAVAAQHHMHLVSFVIPVYSRNS